MNPTKIEWATHTWNPVTGCRHGCPYCYARRIARRFGKTAAARAFEPEFHPERLGQPLKRHKPARIFVCSQADLFGRWVPADWIRAVVDVARQAPQHTFVFLTKAPMRLLLPDFPDNCWVGVSTPTQQALNRAAWLLPEVKASVRFVSAEPLLEPLSLRAAAFRLHWLIIGAETGPGAPPPPRRLAADLAHQADEQGVPVFLKDNIEPVFPEPCREYPA